MIDSLLEMHAFSLSLPLSLFLSLSLRFTHSLSLSLSFSLYLSVSLTLSLPLSLCVAAILDDPMECSRGERLAITLAKEQINRSSNRSITGKLEVDIFELLRDSEYETGETSKCPVDK